MQWLVDRYVPAYVSNREAIEIIMRRTFGRHKAKPAGSKGRINRYTAMQWRTLARDDRRTILRAIIDAHRSNRDLYVAVQTGRF